MKAVQLIKDNLRTIRVRGTKYLGEDLIIDTPYELGLEITYQTEEGNEEHWIREAELNVKDSVWVEYDKDGVAFENVEKTFYMHESKITKGLEVGEQNFLNAYKDRFLYIRDDVANEKFAQYYIYDNVDFNFKGAKLYKINKLQDFKEFKAKLKELKLI